MKMTPEQKAYLAYGYARRKVHEAKEMLAADRYAKKCGKLKNAQNVIACDKYMLKEAITESWQKRAACRAWMSVKKRDCYNCKYRTISPDQYPCQGCYLDTIRKRWEPRKEGV